jgi:hypothetical protein
MAGTDVAQRMMEWPWRSTRWFIWVEKNGRMKVALSEVAGLVLECACTSGGDSDGSRQCPKQ